MAGSSEQCPHGMGSPEWCSLCKNAEKPSVYIGVFAVSACTCSQFREGSAFGAAFSGFRR